MIGGKRVSRAVPVALLAAVASLVTAADRPLSAASAASSPDPVRTLGLVRSFDDEFDGARLDPHRWTSGDPAEGIPQRTLGGNGEHELYFDPAYLDLGIQPVGVHAGMMTITARPFTPVERTVVRANVDALPAGGDRFPAFASLAYSSGRITTRHRFKQLYGYFEGRFRYSPGRGMWPAFWLLPDDGGWPPEIDIMESLGHEPTNIYSTVHSGVMPNQEVRTTLSPADDGFHRYGVLWGPETIDYYIDGTKAGSVKTPADAHKPMYIILNLAVGGFWPGYPDAATHFPATMDVDYVRAWRFPAHPPKHGAP